MPLGEPPGALHMYWVRQAWVYVPNQANDNSSYSKPPALLDFAPLFCSSCRMSDALAASSLVRTVAGPVPECLR
ncbi:hypothetical protein EMIT0P218_70080 [Pseudomonas sp. IT-P218]